MPFAAMLPMIAGQIGGAATGLLKASQDKAIRAAEQKLKAQTARFSPWTGRDPSEIQPRDYTPISDVLKGIGGGSMMGAGAAKMFKGPSAKEQHSEMWFQSKIDEMNAAKAGAASPVAGGFGSAWRSLGTPTAGSGMIGQQAGLF